MWIGDLHVEPFPRYEYVVLCERAETPKVKCLNVPEYA